MGAAQTTIRGVAKQAGLGSTPQAHAYNEGETHGWGSATGHMANGWCIFPSHMQTKHSGAWLGSIPAQLHTRTERCMAGEFSRKQKQTLLDDGWSLLSGHRVAVVVVVVVVAATTSTTESPIVESMA